MHSGIASFIYPSVTRAQSVARDSCASMPAPHAIPTAAATQIVAAVVSPQTTLRPLKMTPAPRNPMPETICSAMREGSKLTSLPRTAEKPYAETSVKAQEPSLTRTLGPITRCFVSQLSLGAHQREKDERREKQLNLDQAGVGEDPDERFHG